MAEREKTVMNKTVSYKLTWMTFFCNLAIVLHHGNISKFLAAKLTPFAGGFMEFFSYISIPVMTYFFFISAFLFFREFNMSKLIGKWKRRVFSLLIPYLIWNTIMVIVKLCNGEELFSEGIFMFIRKSYIFFNGSGSANGPLWYLFRLMEYVVIAPVIYLIIKNKKILTTSAAVIGLMIYNMYTKANNFAFTHYLPIYIIGAYIGSEENAWFENFLSSEADNMKYAVRKLRTKKLIVCLAAVVFFSLITAKAVGLFSIHIFLRSLAAAPLILAMRYLPDIKPNKIAHSGMFLYCGHNIAYKIIKFNLADMPLNVMMSWLYMVTVTLAALIILYLLMDKYCRRFLNVLTGGR